MARATTERAAIFDAVIRLDFVALDVIELRSGRQAGVANQIDLEQADALDLRKYAW